LSRICWPRLCAIAATAYPFFSRLAYSRSTAYCCCNNLVTFDQPRPRGLAFIEVEVRHAAPLTGEIDRGATLQCAGTPDNWLRKSAGFDHRAIETRRPNASGGRGATRRAHPADHGAEFSRCRRP
jgi:hypothetical protein